MHSFNKSRQLRPITRLLSCTNEEKKIYEGMDLAPTLEVFLFRKAAVYKCNMAGKPAVVTRVVDSMIGMLPMLYWMGSFDTKNQGHLQRHTWEQLKGNCLELMRWLLVELTSLLARLIAMAAEQVVMREMINLQIDELQDELMSNEQLFFEI